MRKIYICSVNEEFAEKVRVNFALLVRRKKIQVRQRKDVSAGSEWMASIVNMIGESAVVVVLLTPDLIGDQIFWDVELPAIKAAHNFNGTKIIPFVATPFAGMEQHPFISFDSAAKDGKVTLLDEAAILSMGRSINRLCED